MIEPAVDAFAARYARGEPQVVWTTLVADLETPVSAFLKVAGGAADELPARVGRGRRGARALFDHRARARPGLARERRARRDQPRGALASPTRSSPAPSAPLAALRALIAESRIALPETLPPMAAGVFGYLGYDMVRLMEELPAANPDPIGIPDAIMIRPTVVIVFDAVRGHDHAGDAGAARAGRDARRPRSIARPSG